MTLTSLQAGENPLKIAYIKVDHILTLLPEVKQIEVDTKLFENKLIKQLEIKKGELQEKLQTYQKGQASMSEAVKKKNEEELQQIYLELERSQVESQELLANKQMELYKPIYTKVREAIEAVAKENKFTHVLNASIGGMDILVYVEPKYDISGLVIKKLGIDPIKTGLASSKGNTNSAQKTQNKKS